MMPKELIGIIGGSGLADTLAEELSQSRSIEVETPFGDPSAPIIIGTLGNREIAFLNRHGPGHVYNPSQVPYAANIFAFKQLGVRTVIASGAVGSLRQDIAPGDLVVVDQFIDKTFRRINTFFDLYGAVHSEMAHPVCGRIGQAIVKIAETLEPTTHASGTYICMEGPQFSTRAESLMHRAWGGDLIGMTAMPEAKLAREAQMCYALICLVSDYDCWQDHDTHKPKQALLEEILGNLKQATDNCLELIRAVLASDEELLSPTCACRSSLELAVWTPQNHIDPEERDKFKILFD